MSEATTNIEASVETQRQEVEATLEALRRKFSGGELVAMTLRAVTEARGQSGEVVTSFARQVKANPVPLVLTGVGLAWLMLGQGRPARDIAPEEAAEPTLYDRAQYAADEAAHGPQHAVAQLMAGAYDLGRSGHGAPMFDPARYAADEAAHGPAYVVDQLKTGAYSLPEEDGHAAVDRAKLAADEELHGAAYVNSALRAGAYTVEATKERAVAPPRRRGSARAKSAGDAGRRAGQGLLDFVKQEPLLAGALGLALGAAIGLALPATRREDKAFGPSRDRMRDDALAFARTEMEAFEDGLPNGEATDETPPDDKG
ncbi:MAG: hypothetical protein AAGJ94_10280 [Pseudomonadota bacterium]